MSASSKGEQLALSGGCGRSLPCAALESTDTVGVNGGSQTGFWSGSETRRGDSKRSLSLDGIVLSVLWVKRNCSCENGRWCVFRFKAQSRDNSKVGSFLWPQSLYLRLLEQNLKTGPCSEGRLGWQEAMNGPSHEEQRAGAGMWYRRSRDLGFGW